MSRIPSSLARISSQMSSNNMLSNLRRTNVELLQIQNSISTGKQVNRPSEAPESISVLNQMTEMLERMEQQSVNLSRADAVASVTDQALGDISDLILEAESIALSQIGPLSDPSTRAAQGEVVAAMIEGLREITSRQHNGIYLFSGRATDVNPFEDALGGVRFVGSTQNMTADLGERVPIGINTNAHEALGALSNRVNGTVDLNPLATPDTRITNLNGARNLGVTLGTIAIDVNGTITNVDLAGADTLQDITATINNTLGVDGTLSVSGNGFTLTAGAGNTITISDLGNGFVAADLGIDISATSGSTVGADTNPRLTELTNLAQLGTAVDFASGLQITNGGVTQTIDLSAANTLKDMLNIVNNAGLGVRMSINDNATGVNLVNEVSGTTLSIGEAGGTTATDLGIRSFTDTTAISDLNFGLGLRNTTGQADFQITVHSGAQYNIDIDGATTISDIIANINATTAGDVTASYNTTGNGIQLTDNTGAGATFSITNINNSFAAEDLGILQDAGAGNTINGTDVAQVQSESVFTHLIQLRDALLNNDERLLTAAGEALSTDVDRVALTRAKVGVRSQRILDETNRIEDRKILTQSLISNIQDTDITAAITRFTQLQQQLQATLASGAQSQQLTLLDFLR